MSERLRGEIDDGEPAWDLNGLVDSLRAARESNSELAEQMKRRERPSREVIVEAATDFRAGLFPTHFGVTDFSSESLDYFVGQRLDAGLRKLEQQVRRTLFFMMGSSERDPSLGLVARELTAQFAAKLPAIRVALEKDVRAAFEGDPAATSRAEVLLCYPGIAAIIHHRLAHELYLLGLPLLARILSESAHSTSGIDIHPGAKIGESFFIDHGTGVVIGETSIIGNRVRIYQGVTLGARLPERPNGEAESGAFARHPVIEDDVVIYAGATVLGRVTIGRGSIIGGNVWVTQSLLPGSIVTQARTRQRAGFESGGGI